MLRRVWKRSVEAIAKRMTNGLKGEGAEVGGRADVERRDLFKLLILGSSRHNVSIRDALERGGGEEGEGEAELVAGATLGQLREGVGKLLGRDVEELLAQMAAHGKGKDMTRKGGGEWMMEGFRLEGLGDAQFRLEVGPSGVDTGGSGLFAEVEGGDVAAGTVVGFFPGTVYPPLDVRKMPNYPRVDLGNDYLMARFDNVIVDSKGWHNAGLSAAEAELRDRERERRSSISAGRANGLVHAAAPEAPEINPLALAHFANHPNASKGQAPNVMWAAYDFMDSLDVSLRPYIPNAYVRKQPALLSSAGFGVIQAGLVLVATESLLAGERTELFLDYRYNEGLDLPEWYESVDGEMAAGRWAKQ